MSIPRTTPGASRSGRAARPPGRSGRAPGSALALAALALGLVAPEPAPARQDPYAEAREEMVRRHLASVPRGAEPIDDPAVLRAMRTVPRHEFVPAELRAFAYLNRPLPIGGGQTISQPYIVALMTQLIEPEPDDVVFEVGTGSGYQAAVLGEIVTAVYTIEIDEELARGAAERLSRLGYENVHVRHGDGYAGWPDHAPFDGIVVTAAPEEIPPPLIEQLAPGGRMVIPVGPVFQVQELLLVEKAEDGTVTRRAVAPVQFVPFRRDEPPDDPEPPPRGLACRADAPLTGER